MRRRIFLFVISGSSVLGLCILSFGIALAARGIAPRLASPTIFLPLVATSSTQLVQPGDLQYRGAFRLPDSAARPRTFEYGGNAMTFNPTGDPSGARDGFPGALFVMGHERMPYGELPEGNQVAEITIPAPSLARNINELPQVSFIQHFSNIAQGYFVQLDEIPRVGMAYLNHPATGAKIHLAWGQHLQPDPPVASHAWFDLNLAAPNLRGVWFIGNQSLDSVNGYLFEIPSAWANQFANGRVLATGRYRDGGWSGMGPALFAYKPWMDETGAPAPSGTHLQEMPLLLYAKSTETENIERALTGYQHPDEWEGGAWLTTSSGKAAVIFAGTKSTGAKYWYGYVNPAGAQFPCVDADMVGQFSVCRLANGAPCPPSDLTECAGHTSARGWWSTRTDAQILFYNPDDLARVASGQMQAWEPQPYATLDIDERLFLNPAGIEIEMLGAGAQRRFRIGDIAFDRANALLYVLELFAEDAKPIIHVWKIQ
ncbi:MAG: hypothetical protein L0Y55_17210 [Anaerolineales bacterium]|nr:hypothetical protein [Anaerolineales bacterium]